MSRRRGEEQTQQENVGTQQLRSSKEKSDQVVSTGTAAVAAKLERFAHTQGQTPTKGGQQAHIKTQQNVSGDRKSHGQSSTAVSAAPTTKTVSNKNQETTRQHSEVISDPSPLSEEEPTLKDILQAVNACRSSLGELSDQLMGVKEDLLLVGHDLQKIAERTVALEGRISQLKDDLHPMKSVAKNLRNHMGIYASKLDEIENRSRRDNVRLVGLPEKSKGPNPNKFLERWFIELFGKETLSPFFFQ